MKYFVIDTTIRDGEYEYLQQSPIKANTVNAALDIARREASEWTEHDYREYEVELRAEVSKQEFDIINKYIY